MITNEEMKKVFEFKLLTGKEFMLLTYIDINNFKNLDIKLLAYETDTLKYDLIKYLENLKNKGFLKEDSNGVHTTFTPYQFEETKTKVKKTTKVKKDVNVDITDIAEEFKTVFKEYYSNISKKFITKTAQAKLNIALKKYDKDEILLGFENYLKSNKGTDIQYIMNFERFMNSEVWKDFQEVSDNEVSYASKFNNKNTFIDYKQQKKDKQNEILKKLYEKYKDE